ncbi:flagellar filament capping protein FliD [Thermoanaerobacterium sp. DL9XJH110]|uniref:flagellar filament capping protein FliD n=1 Tax=Thermoanaerobacterium sp. DL9XJH110 TaxID=3386643 RepID=UPI003BB4CE28
MRVSGLVSGLDVDTLVSQLMEIERRPLYLLEQRKTSYDLKKSLWQEINTSLASLKTTLDPLLDKSTYNSKKITISDENILTATYNSDAVVSKYDINVITLASFLTVASDRQGDINASLGLSGTFKIGDGAKTSTAITVNSTDSLKDIMDKINSAIDADGNKINVEASIVDNRLILKGITANDNIVISEDVNGIFVSLGVLNPDLTTFKNKISDASYGSMQVNGVAVSFDKNTGLENIIPGVTLNLKSQGTATLEIQRDADTAINAVKQFVDKYNALLDLINRRLSEKPIQNPANDSERKIGLLRGDFNLIDIKGSLRKMVSDPVSGLNTYNILAKVGITTESTDFGKSGKLIVDEAKLRDVLEKDPDAVYNLFAFRQDVDTDGKVEASEKGVAERVKDYVDFLTGFTSGIITKKLSSFDTIIKDYDNRIEDMEKRLDEVEQRYYRQFTEMEKALSAMRNQSAWLNNQINMFNGE